MRTPESPKLTLRFLDYKLCLENNFFLLLLKACIDFNLKSEEYFFTFKKIDISSLSS